MADEFCTDEKKIIDLSDPRKSYKKGGVWESSKSSE